VELKIEAFRAWVNERPADNVWVTNSGCYCPVADWFAHSNPTFTDVSVGIPTICWRDSGNESHSVGVKWVNDCIHRVDRQGDYITQPDLLAIVDDIPGDE